MQKNPGKRIIKEPLSKDIPNFTKRAWGTRNMSCEECNYNDQDIDTFPCAECHTRH